MELMLNENSRGLPGWMALADPRVVLGAQAGAMAAPTTSSEGIELRAEENWPFQYLPRHWTWDMRATGTGALTFFAEVWGYIGNGWQSIGLINGGVMHSGTTTIRVSEVFQFLARFKRVYFQLLTPTGTGFSLNVRLSPNV